MCCDVKLSKSLSWLLRHGAAKEGLTFDSGGFIDVNKILRLKQFRNYSETDIQRVVETNDKKRFTLRYKNDNNTLQIRANQGHSLKIDEEGLLILLTADTIPATVYHGSYFRHLNSIKTEGLKKMNRNHIHFTPKFPGEPGVVSGVRHNCEVIIMVDSQKALSDGFKFYESDNGVILCPGNEHGILPAKYIKEIWQKSPSKQLS